MSDALKNLINNLISEMFYTPPLKLLKIQIAQNTFSTVKFAKKKSSSTKNGILK